MPKNANLPKICQTRQKMKHTCLNCGHTCLKCEHTCLKSGPYSPYMPYALYPYTPIPLYPIPYAPIPYIPPDSPPQLRREYHPPCVRHSSSACHEQSLQRRVCKWCLPPLAPHSASAYAMKGCLALINLMLKNTLNLST